MLAADVEPSIIAPQGAGAISGIGAALERVLYFDDATQWVLVKWQRQSYWHCSWVPAANVALLPDGLLAPICSQSVYDQIERYRADHQKADDHQPPSPAARTSSTTSSSSREGRCIPGCGFARSRCRCAENNLIQQLGGQQSAVEKLPSLTPSNCHSYGVDPSYFVVERVIRIYETNTAAVARPSLAAVGRTVVQSAVDDNRGNDNNDDGDEQAAQKVLIKWCGLPYSSLSWEDIHHSCLASPSGVRALRVFKQNRFALVSRHQRPHKLPLLSRFHLLASTPGYVAAPLRDDQLSGVNFLRTSWYSRRPVVVGDDDGSGKKIMFLVYVATLLEHDDHRNPVVVVLTRDNVEQWRAAVDAFVPQLSAVYYLGAKAERKRVRSCEFFFSEDRYLAKHKRHLRFNVVFVPVDHLLADCRSLARISWSIVCVDVRDEPLHKKTLAALSSLRAHQRVVLSSPACHFTAKAFFRELNFIAPAVFPSLTEFLNCIHQHQQDRKDASKLSTTAVAASSSGDVLSPATLQELVGFYVLARSRDAPPAAGDEAAAPALCSAGDGGSFVEAPVFFDLTPAQRGVYERLIAQHQDTLRSLGDSEVDGAARADVEQLLRQLQNASDHVGLFPGHVYAERDQLSARDHLAAGSSKVQGLIDLLTVLSREREHKVLLLCGNALMRNILEDLLFYQCWRCDRWDASLNAIDRKEVPERFNAPLSTGFVFMLGTESLAAGLPFSLPRVDTVVVFNADAGLSSERLRSTCTALRIGTDLPPERANGVIVLRFACLDTVEELLLQHQLADHRPPSPAALCRLGVALFAGRSSTDDANNVDDEDSAAIASLSSADEESNVGGGGGGGGGGGVLSSAFESAHGSSLSQRRFRQQRSLEFHRHSRESIEAMRGFLTDRSMLAFRARTHLRNASAVRTARKLAAALPSLPPPGGWSSGSALRWLCALLAQRPSVDDESAASGVAEAADDHAHASIDSLVAFSADYADFFDEPFLPADADSPELAACCFQPAALSSRWDASTQRLLGMCRHERAIFARLVSAFGFVDASWSHLTVSVERLLPPWQEPARRLLACKGVASLADYGNLLMGYLQERNDGDAFADGTPKAELCADRHALLSRIVSIDLIRAKAGECFTRGKPFHIDDRHWTPLTLSWEISKWTPQDDFSLLIGVLRYGWTPGAVQQILADATLPLLQRCQRAGIDDQDGGGLLKFLARRFRLICRSLLIEQQTSAASSLSVHDEPPSDLLRIFRSLYNDAIYLCQSSAFNCLPAPSDIQILLAQVVALQHALAYSRPLQLS